MKTKWIAALILGLLALLPLGYAGYATAIYTEQGGAKQVVASGGEVQFESGSTLDVQAGTVFSLGKTDTEPGTPAEGQIYADDSEGLPKYYNGVAWVALGAGTFAGGAITDDVVIANGKYIQSSTTTAQTTGIQGYDVDGTAYIDAFKVTNGDTVAYALGHSTASLAIASTGLNVTTAGAVSGVTTLAMTDNLSLANGKSIVSSTTTAQSGSIKVYDNDTGPAYVNALSWTNGNTPAVVLGSANGTGVIATSDWGIDATGTATKLASVNFDGGATVYHDLVAVSNAEVKTLFSAPKVLVAAPGAHNMVDVVSVTLLYDYAAAGFNAAANNLTCEYKADASGATATSAIAQNAFLNGTADAVCKLTPVALASTAAADIENQPVVLYCATADPTTGGGVLRVQISYRIIPSGF